MNLYASHRASIDKPQTNHTRRNTMDEVFIPILSIILIFGVLPTVTLFYLHKIKSKKLNTLIKLAELGGSVDPEMMKMLETGGKPGYKSDYKWGLIWLAIGIPITIGLMSIEGAQGVSFAMIPMFIGFAYLISGKLRLNEPDKD